MQTLKCLPRLLSSLALLTLAACHDDERALPNPCQAQKANPLTFHFVERTGSITQDTTYTNQTVGFVAPGAPYTAYQWQIGPLTQRSTRTFGLVFDDQTVGNIKVRLIATRPPNRACFAKDDGVDTLDKVLTLMPWSARSPMYGRYQGALKSAPRDTFTVRVYLEQFPSHCT